MEFTWIRATTDQVVSPNPSKVGSVILTPSNDSKKADISLYDGESTSDPKLLTIRTASGVTNTVNFQPYLETKRGLYLDIGGDVGEVLIQLMWEPE
ncbi:hypothetical protein LCGC14_3142740 [marine sediment metagenome]|uniref:Uncharacterized protein n=1 Tax=marine sediment metagenome TaxID=412755 RepID=A0A0F8YKQ2_9ZZZZ